MNKVIIIVALISSIFRTNFGLAKENISLPPDVQEFVDHFHSFYNIQDLKTIYKDSATSRFQSSDSYDNFKNNMAALYEKFGKIKESHLTFSFHDTYNFENQTVDFYRVEYKAVFDNTQGFERFVVMKKRARLFLDGFALIADGKLHLAQGNLYGFDPIDSENPRVSPLAYFLTLKDTKTKFIWESLFDSAKMNFLQQQNNRWHKEQQKGYYENGQLKYDIPYKDGKREGLAEWYYQNGQLQVTMLFREDKPHGEIKEYFENGKIKFEGIMQQGQPVGTAKSYYETGQVKWEWVFKDGPSEYVLKEYQEDGSLKEERTYSYDKLISTRTPSEAGNPSSE